MTHKLFVILHGLFVVTDTQRSSHLVGVAFGKSPAALLSATSAERLGDQHPAWFSDLKPGEDSVSSKYCSLEAFHKSSKIRAFL